MNTENQKHEYCHIFIIKEKDTFPYIKKFNTNRSVEWTIKQYSRNRDIEYMNLI